MRRTGASGLKGKVVRHIEGKDGVVRGIILLHKGHHIQRPLILVCLLEIKAVEVVKHEQGQMEPELQARSTQRAAEIAHERIRLAVNQDN